MENKKILILGSSGFLGSDLVKFLLKNNEVVHFDVNPPHPPPNDMFKNNTGSVSLFQKEVKRRCKGQSVLILNCGDKVEA